MRILTCLAVLALSLSALAEESKPPAKFHMLVLKKGASEKDTADLRKLVEPLFVRLVHAPSGYPMLVPSEKIEGAPAGKMLLVAGFCADEAEAKKLRDIFMASGLWAATTLSVSGNCEALCPTFETKPCEKSPIEADHD